MTTIRERLLATSNDYSALEARYRDATGGSLVWDPYASFHNRIADLSRSASIVIASHNSRASLELSLMSIESTTFNRDHPDLLEVIVVDDGSTDGTCEMVSSLRLDIDLRYIRQERAGIAAAHNTAVAHSASEVVIFADSDIVHLPFGIEELMKRHQVLDGVTLVGFRFDIAPDDPRLDKQHLRSNLIDFTPDFQRDFRLSFPGRPTNMCRETSHLKLLGNGRTLNMSNGAHYNLPAMVVGALFSLERDDFIAMGGSDERLHGWGCEDSLIGAKSIALGNFIVPVYSATAGHISHPAREETQAADFARNIATAETVLDEEGGDRVFEAEPARRRVTEGRDFARTVRGVRVAELPANYPLPPAAFEQWGDYFYSLGRYREAIEKYQAAALLAPGSFWPMLGIAKSKRELRAPDSCEAFESCLELNAPNPWGCFEASLAFADAGDHGRAGQLLDSSVGLYESDWAKSLGSDAHKRRGNHHAAQELHAIAATDFTLALIADPGNVWAHFDRGVSLQALGQSRLALRCVDEASRLLHPADGNRTWVHSRLAELHLELGDLNHAKLEIEAALNLSRENDHAAAALQRLNAISEEAAHLRVPVHSEENDVAIPGWLAPEEAGLLAGAVALCCDRLPPTATLVELGSYCGKSTAVIAAAIRDSGRRAVLTAVDPHEDRLPVDGESTATHLDANLRRLGLDTFVKVVIGRSQTVPWDEDIGFLFIDALHDYDSVAADFGRFRMFVVAGGLVGFHDYSDYFPGVRRLVNEVLAGRDFTYLSQRGHLIFLERRSG